MEIIKMFEVINRVAKELFDEDVQKYSGRGMYGEMCLGISCENPLKVMGKLISNINEHIFEKSLEKSSVLDAGEVENCLGVMENVTNLLVKSVKTDSLGMKSIIYWPNIPYKRLTNFGVSVLFGFLLNN